MLTVLCTQLQEITNRVVVSGQNEYIYLARGTVKLSVDKGKRDRISIECSGAKET